jgi:HAD superfamily hydrolase (TIGR01509 family)
VASKFKGAIFDMDGTILDSMGCWRSLNVEFLKKRGLPVPEEIQGQELITHSGAAVKLYLQRFDLGMTFQEIIREFEDDMGPLYQTVILPKAGAADCLKGLKKAGLKLCVATVTPQGVAERALERHGLLDLFEFVANPNDIGINKSKPEFFYLISDRMGLAATDCVVFEDAVYAMRGAKAAGCKVVAIEDATSAPDLKEILEISDIYLHDYNLFTLETLERLDRRVPGTV